MFKKYRKTTATLGAIVIGAMTAFPIAVSVNKAQDDTTTLNNLEAWDVPLVNPTIVETFGGNEGKQISTHDWVIKTSGIDATNFADRTSTLSLFDNKKDPLNALYTDPDTTKGLGDTYAAEYKKVSDAFGLNIYYKTALTGGIVSSFISADGHTKLFNTLNRDLATKAIMGQRYNFSVPSKVIDLSKPNTGSGKGADVLPSTPVTASAANPYVYKVASIDATNVALDKTIALDYMYQDATSTKAKKAQIIFKGTDYLTKSTKSISDLIQEGSIFLRSMDDKAEASTTEITSGFNYANSGLTITREGDAINVYSSLQSNDAKAAVMLDTSTSPGEDAHVTVGDLQDEQQVTGSTATFKTFTSANKGAKSLQSFKVFALKKKWEDESSYLWKDGSSTEASKISFYMKAGTELKSIPIRYTGVKLTTASITIKATDSGVTLEPKTPLSVEAAYFEDGAESMEVIPEPVNVPNSYGTWYKVTIHVAKSTSAKHFLIKEDSGNEEAPWVLQEAPALSDVFFKQPWATDQTLASSPGRLVLPFQKHINQTSVQSEVIKEVYGSWVDGHPWITNPAVAALLNIARTTADGGPWKTKGLPFTYNEPSVDANGNAGINNPKIINMGSWKNMSDVIKALSVYHDKLLKIEKLQLQINTDDQNGIFEPQSEGDFEKNVASLLDASPLMKDIEDKIKAVMPILALTATQYQSELDDYNKGHAQHTARADKLIDFDDLIGKYGQSIFEVKPEDKTAVDKDLTGNTTVAKFIAGDIEKLIPQLFESEWAKFVSKMKAPQAVKFNNFLNHPYTNGVKVIDKDAVVKGYIVVDANKQAKVMTEAEFQAYTLKDGESAIDFADIASGKITTKTATTGRALIEALYTVLYRTGMYKGFIDDPALQQTFVALMNHDKTDGEPYPLWGVKAYEVNGDDLGNKMTILEDIVEGLENSNGGMSSDADKTTDASDGAQSFSDFLADKNTDTDDIADLLSKVVQQLSNGDENSQEYVWTEGNKAHTSLLARMIITNNVVAVADYLEKETKADKSPMLAKRYAAFRAAVASSRGLAQLGPKINHYDIQGFLDGLSEDDDQTPVLMEEMLQVDPVKVLIPDTSATKTTEVLMDSGGKVVFGLIVAAGVIMAVIGSILLFLSFTKRLVVNGKTWSVKLIIMRVAIVAILIVGLYMLAAGTVLPGHEALTTVLKV